MPLNLQVRLVSVLLRFSYSLALSGKPQGNSRLGIRTFNLNLPKLGVVCVTRLGYLVWVRYLVAKQCRANKA